MQTVKVVSVTFGVMVCVSGFALAQSTVRKCIDANGKALYQAEPCSGSLRESGRVLSKEGWKDALPEPSVQAQKPQPENTEDKYLVFHSGEWKTVTKAELSKLQLSTSVETGRSRYGALPTIGMSADDAQFSAWGAPKSKNKTETASGVTEQWVYPNQGYLYFRDGKLTSIQTQQ